MALSINHVHLKTHDPKATAQFYVDNFGGEIVGEAGNNGLRVRLHGLHLNITTIIPTQQREQHLGVEHLALNTDDYAGTLAGLRAKGVQVLEELQNPDGRRVGFLQGPDGVQVEVIEQRS